MLTHDVEVCILCIEEHVVIFLLGFCSRTQKTVSQEGSKASINSPPLNRVLFHTPSHLPIIFNYSFVEFVFIQPIHFVVKAFRSKHQKRRL